MNWENEIRKKASSKRKQEALEDIVDLLRKAHKMAMQYQVYELNDAIPQYIEDAIDAVAMQIKPEYSDEYEDRLREEGRR